MKSTTQHVSVHFGKGDKEGTCVVTLSRFSYHGGFEKLPDDKRSVTFPFSYAQLEVDQILGAFARSLVLMTYQDITPDQLPDDSQCGSMGNGISIEWPIRQ